jgi:hypothetical protein
MKSTIKKLSEKFTKKSSKQPKVDPQKKMESENQKNAAKEATANRPKGPSLRKIIRNLFQRFVVVFVRFLSRYVIWGERGLTVPPPDNLILYDSASALASKIRDKKVGFLVNFVPENLVNFYQKFQSIFIRYSSKFCTRNSSQFCTRNSNKFSKFPANQRRGNKSLHRANQTNQPDNQLCGR